MPRSMPTTVPMFSWEARDMPAPRARRNASLLSIMPFLNPRCTNKIFSELLNIKIRITSSRPLYNISCSCLLHLSIRTVVVEDSSANFKPPAMTSTSSTRSIEACADSEKLVGRRLAEAHRCSPLIGPRAVARLHFAPEPARAVRRPLATLQMMQLSRAFLGEEISVGVLLPRYYVYVS